MKKTRILSFILAVGILLSSMQVFAFASESDAHEYAENEVVYIFEDGISEEMQAKIIASINGEEDDAKTYNIICDLLGHNVETTETSTITHKAKTTAPRCLKKTYSIETCSRCDEVISTMLVKSEYIFCCS